MMRYTWTRGVAPWVVVTTLAVPAASAQQMFVYPDRGQSSQQQSQDRYQCHLWAVQQTGFDPTAAAAPPGRHLHPRQPRRGKSSRARHAERPSDDRLLQRTAYVTER